MRILAVCGSVPFPPTDGRSVRQWNLLGRLAVDTDVTVLAWRAPGTADDVVAEAARPFRSLIAPRMGIASMTLPRRLARRAAFLAGGAPSYVQAMLEERGPASPQWDQTIRALAEDHRREPFDVVSFEEEALTALPLHLEGTRRVVHRLQVFRRLIDALPGTGARRLVEAIERPGWDRFDRRSLRGADLVVATTDESADALRPLAGDTPVLVVPNGVDVSPLPSAPSSGKDLAFIGWMSYAANVDAITWFVRTVWPRVLERHPATTLRIVGREPVEEVRALAGPRVIVTGEVDDVRAAISGARAGIVPLRAGMGIKNKTLELLAMGLPVVSLPAGCEGIGADRGDGLIAVADADAFAAAVTALLDDPGAADALGAAGRAYVARHHSWDAIARDHGRALRSLVGGGS